VWMGTRFIATEEAFAHRNYKDRIARTDTAGTVVTRAHSGKPCRLIRNAFTDSWAGRESEILGFPLQARQVGEPASVLGRHQGDVDNGVLPAGQSCGLIDEVLPAARVVADTVRQARETIQSLNRLTRADS
ncbi:MAG: nitronate monooxygenase, partial [Gammaproteobacteria bacterium]|nr:nitronate monooxygenase [Gammaproteobacteria bacterium]